MANSEVHATLLAQLQEPDAIFQPNATDVLKEFLKVEGRPEEIVRAFVSGFRGYAEMCNLLSQWTEFTGSPPEQIQGMIVKTVSDQVKQVYDPSCTRSVFQARHRNIPWMNFMVTSPYWRSVLYELAEQHKSDAVLGLALSIIEEHGHQDELATILLGFRLFNQALVQSITKMCSVNEWKLQEDLVKFKKMCAQSPNAYLYTQLVLLNAMELKNGERLARLWEELEKHVAQEHKGSRLVGRMGYLLMGLSQHKELANGVFAMLENGKTNPADMMKIHRAYFQPLDKPPSVKFLHNTALLDMILDDLFITTRDIPVKYVDKYVACLAYATCVSEDGNTSQLEETQKALTLASEVAKKNLFGPQLEQRVPILQHYIASFPVVSMGILRWIRCNMCDRSYFEKGTHTLSLQRFLTFVVEIAATQVRQRSICVEVLRSTYEAIEEAQTEDGMVGEAARVKTEILDALVQLLLADDGEIAVSILNWIEALSLRSSTNAAMMRQFVKSLLSKVTPPFSCFFVEFVCTSLINCVPESSSFAHTQQLLRIFEKGPKAPTLITEFLTGARETPNLTAKAVSLLEQVLSRISPPVKVIPKPLPPVAPPSSSASTASPAQAKPAAVVKSSTVIKIANLDPSVIKKTESTTKSAKESTKVATRSSSSSSSSSSTTKTAKAAPEPEAKKKQVGTNVEKKSSTQKKATEKKKTVTKKSTTKKASKKRDRDDDDDFQVDNEEEDEDEDGGSYHEELDDESLGARSTIPRNVKETRKPVLSLTVPINLLPKKPKKGNDSKAADADDVYWEDDDVFDTK